MRYIVNYTHLATKIRAMKSRMLTDEDFDNLLRMQSVKDIASYLQNHTYYKPNFEGLYEEKLHRGDLEVMLYRSMISDALKIARHLKGNDNNLFRFVYRRQEMEDVKKMLRALQMGRSLDSLNRKTLFISRQSHIDFNKSLKARNIRELVATLKDTNYYFFLEPLIVNDNRINLFAAEMAMDLYYYKQILKDIDTKSSGKNKQLLQKSFGLDSDYKNLMWIYRGKKFYNINKEILYSYMLPGGYKLKKNKIVELVEAETAEEVLKLLKKGPYGDIINFESDHWDNSFYKYYGKQQETYIRQLPTTLAPIIAYIFIKEIEIMNLTTIIEGVRYKVDPSGIEAYLSR